MKQHVPQTYENHRSYDIAHILTFVSLLPAILVSLASFVPVWALPTRLALMQLVMVYTLCCLGFILYKVRHYPLTIQDRVIRLEMRLRLQRLLSTEDQWQINGLSTDQLMALRFASDEELPALMKRVLDEHITDRDAIKRMITYWTPDYERI